MYPEELPIVAFLEEHKKAAVVAALSIVFHDLVKQVTNDDLIKLLSDWASLLAGAASVGWIIYQYFKERKKKQSHKKAS